MPRWLSSPTAAGMATRPSAKPPTPPPVARDHTSREVLPPRRARCAGELWATACEKAYTGATVAS